MRPKRESKTQKCTGTRWSDYHSLALGTGVRAQPSTIPSLKIVELVLKLKGKWRLRRKDDTH